MNVKTLSYLMMCGGGKPPILPKLRRKPSPGKTCFPPRACLIFFPHHRPVLRHPPALIRLLLLVEVGGGAGQGGWGGRHTNSKGWVLVLQETCLKTNDELFSPTFQPHLLSTSGTNSKVNDNARTNNMIHQIDVTLFSSPQSGNRRSSTRSEGFMNLYNVGC